MVTLGITGSTGHVGGRVADLLGPAVDRLSVRDRNRAPRIEGDPEVVEASYGDREAAGRALSGVDVLLMVSASESPTRRDEHRTFIQAAADAQVAHVVYTSYANAAPDSTFTLGRDHWHAEQAIRASGMGFTLLRDSLYADFFPLLADDAGVIRGPAGDGRIAPVARADVADVAAAVLLDPAGHLGATYTLTGPGALSLSEATERMAAALGRHFSYIEESVEEAYESRRAFSSGQWQLDAWVSTYLAIREGALEAVSTDVERVAGHPARTLEQAVLGQ
jgi:uncharacterized protein YbjT (DUF2867 family)